MAKLTTKKKTVIRQSSGDGHPYLKLSFWRNPTNHFWETAMYTEAGKEYFRDRLSETVSKEKRPFILDIV
jgi:hypothetical protein